MSIHGNSSFDASFGMSAMAGPAVTGNFGTGIFDPAREIPTEETSAAIEESREITRRTRARYASMGYDVIQD